VKIAGSAVLHAPAERVWAALNDPAVLARTIPGCSHLEPVGSDSYAMTVTAGVASIKGVYKGQVALHDQQPPGSFRLRASGAGAPGTVTADVLVRLSDTDDGSTQLDYDADAVVGGMVGGVGQRVLAGVAKKTAGEFFKAVDGVLAGGGPDSPPAADSPAPPESPASADSPASAAGAVPPAQPAWAARPASAAQDSAPPAALPPSAAPAPAVAAGGRDFLSGALVGAAAALLGVLVGAAVARRS
jgi:carbon monoxide dehydrogenase subunit G